MHGFLLSKGQYTTLDDPVAFVDTQAYSINKLGQIVGNFADSHLNSNGFLLSNGVYETIDDPFGVFGTFIRGINDSGQIVGYYDDAEFVTHGFTYHNGIFTTIDVHRSTSTVVGGVNNSSEIIGTFDLRGTHGFLFQNGRFTEITGPAGSLDTFGNGLNNLGEAVGTYSSNNSGISLGFLLSHGVYTTIDDPAGVQGTSPSGINDSGLIVGDYFDKFFNGHGFVAIPVKSSAVVTAALSTAVDGVAPFSRNVAAGHTPDADAIRSPGLRPRAEGDTPSRNAGKPTSSAAVVDATGRTPRLGEPGLAPLSIESLIDLHFATLGTDELWE
jgi:probable HAF family extracellular repeat protein